MRFKKNLITAANIPTLKFCLHESHRPSSFEKMRASIYVNSSSVNVRGLGKLCNTTV